VQDNGARYIAVSDLTGSTQPDGRIQFKPDFRLARNNLAYALPQRGSSQARK
jgi:hypothetical protein